MSHTPGPWRTSGLDPNVIGPVRVLVMDGASVPQSQAVARLIDRGDEAAANARLIAAAPELYEEAKRLRKLLNDLDRACIQAAERGAMLVHVGDLRQLANAPSLDAAIAKAEGQ